MKINKIKRGKNGNKNQTSGKKFNVQGNGNKINAGIKKSNKTEQREEKKKKINENKPGPGSGSLCSGKPEPGSIKTKIKIK